MPSPDDSRRPELSVLVPTHARPERVAALLARLDAQSLAPERFELVLVDDGSPAPVELERAAHAFAITLLRQASAGPAAARNAGLERCRAPLTLILNDDAVPADDLLTTHLEAHARLADAGPIAVLGSFQFTDEARRRPFVQLLAESDLLFDFPGLRPDVPLPWTFFWTCNLSLSTELLRAAGGFDSERFREAIVEDVELGYRLAQAGLTVRHVPEAVAWHDHAIAPAAYFRRALRLGANLARMHQKHGDPAILWFDERTLNEDTAGDVLGGMQAAVEGFHAPARRLIAKLEQVDAVERALSRQELELLTGLVRRMSTVWVYAGVLAEREGSRALEVLDRGAPVDASGEANGELTGGATTSVVVVTRDALDQTRRCLEALRRAADPRHPQELVFVDNGSTDGTAEYLAGEPDVRLIVNETNLGAPRARNQGLGLARGERIVFMDSDVMVTDGWLGRLAFHAAVDARSGCVGCLSDRAAHEQQLELPGAGDPAALAAYAAARAASHARQARFQPLLSSFLLLVRRELLETIGGFDERFGPWGFEDDDFTLRAHLAGFRNRVALDVFVRHEGYAGPKAVTHAGLLERNWLAFAAKWELAGARYGDYAGLERLRPGTLARERLWIEPDPAARPADPVAPLPRPSDPTSHPDRACRA